MEPEIQNQTDLFNGTPFENLIPDYGVVKPPSRIKHHSCSEISVEYEFQGKGAVLVYEVVWSFRWGRFYGVKTTKGDYGFSLPRSTVLTESELVYDIQELLESEDFELIQEEFTDKDKDLFKNLKC